MKEMLETMPRIELALIIIGVFVLILGIILGYAMIHEYRIYLLTSSSCHPKALVKEFSYFLMPCHQHGLGVNLLVQR